MAGLLTSGSAPTGTTRLGEWLKENREALDAVMCGNCGEIGGRVRGLLGRSGPSFLTGSASGEEQTAAKTDAKLVVYYTTASYQAM